MKKNYIFSLVICLIVFTFQSKAQCWQMSANGDFHTLVLNQDGSIWAAGDNTYGQLGDGQASLIRITLTEIPIGNDWVYISANAIQSFGIKQNGTLWAWGYNQDGVLGDGTTNTQFSPVQVGNATNWVAVSAGKNHTVAMKSDGSIWSWGNNDSGQMGDGTFTGKRIPTRIGTDTDWQMVSAGGFYTIGLKSNGTLWTWGNNDYRQLGNGSNNMVTSPTQIASGTFWNKIEAGLVQSMAIGQDSTLWIWGYNDFNQLGLGAGAPLAVDIPTQLSATHDWKNLAGGGRHSMATKYDNTLWAWGSNQDGQLGDGTFIDKDVPTQVGFSSQWGDICASYYSSVALTNTDTLFSWGKNDYGQGGIGSFANQSSPALLSCLLSGVYEDLLHNPIIIYPNPASEMLTISFPEISSASSTLFIYDATGKEIFSTKINDSQKRIDASQFDNGLYLLRVISNNSSWVKTLGIQH